MNWRATMLVGVVGIAVALSAGVAQAATIDCPAPGPTVLCWGTNEADTLTGTALHDYISGQGAGDLIVGGDGNDNLSGDDLKDPTLDGADTLSGGAGDDRLAGYGRNDLLNGGAGNDFIDAREFQQAGRAAGNDTVKGGAGNDHIEARDGVRDAIDCGKGRRDVVWFDEGVDTVKNCEEKHPV